MISGFLSLTMSTNSTQGDYDMFTKDLAAAVAIASLTQKAIVGAGFGGKPLC